MGDGEGALLDAQQCRMMRPDWAKAYYRMAAAHIVLEVRLHAFLACQSVCLLPIQLRCGHAPLCLDVFCQDYEQAAEAVLEAEDLDPETEDIEIEIRQLTC
jgi:hypothetical protein